MVAGIIVVSESQTSETDRFKHADKLLVLYVKKNWHQIVFWSWISISLFISEYRFFLFIITLKTFPGIKLAKGYHLVFCAGSPSKAFTMFLQHKTIQTEELLPQIFFFFGGVGGGEGGGGYQLLQPLYLLQLTKEMCTNYLDSKFCRQCIRYNLSVKHQFVFAG